MEEIRRLKELVEAKERNARNNLRWHNSVKAEQAKIEQLEREMARIAIYGEREAQSQIVTIDSDEAPVTPIRHKDFMGQTTEDRQQKKT